MFICCEWCVLSGRGLCDGLITRPEESYRLWRVVVCDIETPRIWGPWPTGGDLASKRKKRQRERRRLSYGLGDSEFDPRKGQEIFVFFK